MRGLLQRAHLTRQQIENWRSGLRVSDQIEFLNPAALALNDQLLRLHRGKWADMRRITLFYYALASSAAVCSEQC